MEDRPGGLYEVIQVLGDAGINIEYSYAYSGRKCAVLIMRVEEIDAAAEEVAGLQGRSFLRSPSSPESRGLLMASVSLTNMAHLIYS